MNKSIILLTLALVASSFGQLLENPKFQGLQPSAGSSQGVPVLEGDPTAAGGVTFAYLPGFVTIGAGVPTGGTPTIPPLYVDTTGEKLYWYDGASWKTTAAVGSGLTNWEESGTTLQPTTAGYDLGAPGNEVGDIYTNNSVVLSDGTYDLVKLTSTAYGGSLEIKYDDDGDEAIDLFASNGTTWLQLRDSAGGAKAQLASHLGLTLFDAEEQSIEWGPQATLNIVELLSIQTTGNPHSLRSIHEAGYGVGNQRVLHSNAAPFRTDFWLEIQEKAAIDVDTPIAGHGLLFVDSVDSSLKFKDDTGTVTALTGGGGAPEGTSVLSTGEVGGVKFLREDGDGTSSWQTIPAGGGDAWSDPVDAVITPDADGTRDLGLTGTRFATGYFDAVDVTGDITSATMTGVAIDKTSTHAIFTEKHAASHTLTASECYGGVYYATAAVTLTLPPIEDGMSVSIMTVGAVAVSVDVDAADLIMLDGVALDDGDQITNTSTSGDMAVLTYYDGTGWYAATNTWTDGG